ncbi:insulin receptor substrate 1 chico isoform X2 [Lycorma delicatula]|uniref:insulin receptor substrate 1 chico isoform X2 n=1 Tax=Lycorma delicatula TaxID=130591 RepID=UPI003F51244F
MICYYYLIIQHSHNKGIVFADMSSGKSWPSLGGDRETARHVTSGGDIVKMGYLKKLKTMKKKFFVLRRDSPDASARLEYYDTEKKFKSNHAPKRSISLKTCFNINKRNDTRQKWVIALYTKNDCFCLVMETEEEVEEWLKLLLTLQHGEGVPDGEQPKPTFEHVWQVTVQKKELGHSRNILGPYLLCLTDRTLSLVKMDPGSEKPDTIEFSLQSIRRCGDLESFFYMEVGQSSVTGAGNLWMQTEDNNIAQNMHAAIMSACRNCKDLGPVSRGRSHSTNESSRPMNQGTRSTHDGHPRWTILSEGVYCHPALLRSWSVLCPTPERANLIRTLTTSAVVAATTITTTTTTTAATRSLLLSLSSTASYSYTSVSSSCSSTTINGTASVLHSANNSNNNNNNNYNNSYNNNAIGSCGSGICGGNAGGGVVVGMHQRTYSFPLSPIPPSRRASTGTRPNKKPTTSHSLSGVRERCDSLPTRPRTTSEGATPPISQHSHRHVLLQPSAARPHSMYTRTVSYSPPVIDSSPVSPDSRDLCSTDSAGSSLSMEGEGMGMGDGTWESGMDRYGHSLTPDEPVILEENVDDCENMWHPSDDYVGPDKNSCLTISNHLSHKNSPNPSSSGFKSSSPSQGSLADICSPCGSSPLESSGPYMPMSPVDKPAVTSSSFGGLRLGIGGGSSSVNHSRGSSLAEDGYVHMAPVLHDDGYVDMDPGSRHRRNIPDHYRSGELSPASSCSIISGTPSTDIRFSEYNLEKVSTFITPSEDEILPNERPTRAYSVGSRPTFNKRNDIINQSDCQQRVRAFSVGSRCPRVHSAHLTPPPRHPLSSSHSSVEPSEDLMELDFTRNSKSRNRNHSKKPSSSERLSVPPSSVASSAASSYSTAEGSYMEMSPRSSPKPSDNEMDNSHFCPSPPKNNRISNFVGRSPPKSYVDMKAGFPSSSPPVMTWSGLSSAPLYNVPEGESGYMEMTSGCRGELLPGSSPPILIHSLRDERPRTPSDDSYMEMNPVEAKSVVAKTYAPRVDFFPVNEQLKPQNFPKTTSSPPIKPALMSTSNILKSKTNTDDYLNMSIKRKLSLVEDNNRITSGRTNSIDSPKKAPYGYVEMTVGNSKPMRKSSLDNFKVGEQDYMNMSGGKKEHKGSRKERNRYSSQPIAIQSTSTKEQTLSTSPVFTFVGRKHSTGTPPKVPSYLPLGNFSTSPSSSPYSSLQRRTRKTPSRRESKDLPSSGSSTPIFPFSLNSPSSPMKPTAFGQANKDKECYESAAKCPVDATSGTVRISYSPADQSVASLQPLSSSVSYIEQNEYVNYNPLSTEVKESLYNDYAPMRPVNPLDPSRKISAPPILNSNSKSRSVDRIVVGLSNLTVSSPEINTVPNNNNNDNNNSNCKNNRSVMETVASSHHAITSVASVICAGTVPSPCVSVTKDKHNNNSDSEVLNNGSTNDIVSNSSASTVITTVNANSSLFPSSLSYAVLNSAVTTTTTTTNVAPPVTNTSSATISEASESTIVNCVAMSTTDGNEVVRTSVSPNNNISPATTVAAAASFSSAINNTAPTSGTVPTITTSSTTITTTTAAVCKELHYASLDLARSSSVEESSGSAINSSSNCTRSLRNQSSTSSASTPSPNINQNPTPMLTYVEIDFSKSSSNNTNSAVH